ncbi:hypothetical protein GCM10007893_01020 [Paracoccus marinus]|nr:hypothetical protein GCM10007893_01020 [Paracoccus marinus]
MSAGRIVMAWAGARIGWVRAPGNQRFAMTSARPKLLAICLAVPLAAAPVGAMPADQADIDAPALDACIAQTGGGQSAMSCVGTTRDACVAKLKATYKDVGEVHGEMPCLGAERDYWEGRLTDRYDRLMAIEQGRAAERAEALRQAERAWIAFRDALCSYDRITNGHGTGGETAEPICLVRETARQSLILDGYIADRN